MPGTSACREPLTARSWRTKQRRSAGGGGAGRRCPATEVTVSAVKGTLCRLGRRDTHTRHNVKHPGGSLHKLSATWELSFSHGTRRKPASSAGAPRVAAPWQPGVPTGFSLQPQVLGKSLETGPRPQGKACGQAHQKPPRGRLAFPGGKRTLGTSHTQTSPLLLTPRPQPLAHTRRAASR